MRSIFENTFRRYARERRRTGDTLEEEGKMRSILKISSDGVPASEGERAIP